MMLVTWKKNRGRKGLKTVQICTILVGFQAIFSPFLWGSESEMITGIEMFNNSKPEVVKTEELREPATTEIETKKSTTLNKKPPTIQKRSFQGYRKPQGETNLPSYFGDSFRQDPDSGSLGGMESPRKGARLKGVYRGNQFDAIISKSIIAYPEDFQTIEALIVDGDLKGSIAIGEARLNKNSKGIEIHFKALGNGQDHREYEFKAIGRPKNGEPFFVGEYVTNEKGQFMGAIATEMAAAYFDSQIQRTITENGQVVEVPSLDQVGKKALSKGLLGASERFEERMKRATEYSKLEGPIYLDLLITETPRLARDFDE